MDLNLKQNTGLFYCFAIRPIIQESECVALQYGDQQNITPAKAQVYTLTCFGILKHIYRVVS